MIDRQELEQAIAEIERLPSSYQNCEKLSVLYTVYNQLYGEKYPQDIINQYSQKRSAQLIFDGNSEFIKLINQKGIERSFKVITELIEVIQVTNPKLYEGVIRKLYNL